MTTLAVAAVPEGLRFLCSALREAGHEARIVGGAVRDSLLGVEPKDWDVATPATPQEAREIMQRAGARVIDTGLQHGTITAVLNKQPFEITTLRRDVSTDGRRATVAWSHSFREDAARRDFTINAMSACPHTGKLFDYFDGRAHLADRRIVFVGDPNRRIQEDYLRILRWFRFRGRLHVDRACESDIVTLEAIREQTAGLERISGERIWMEMARILQSASCLDQLYLMDKHGVLDAIGLQLALPERPGLAGSKDTSWARSFDAPPAARLAMLAPNRQLLLDLRERWRLSNQEFDTALFVFAHKHLRNEPLCTFWRMLHDDQVRGQAPKATPELVDALLCALGRDKEARDLKSRKLIAFPLRGSDLITRGMAPGPHLGKTMGELRRRWVASDMQASAGELLASLGEDPDADPPPPGVSP